MDWNNVKVLVTGGGGFLGKALVGKLLGLGADVAVFSRGEYPELLERGVEMFRGDIRDSASLSAACAGRDVVFNVAAKAGLWGPRDEFMSVNAGGARNVVSCCLENGVPFLVHTSSPSVVFSREDISFGDESLPYPSSYPAAYPASKAEAERIVSAAASDGLRTVSLRPHLLWGVGDPHILPRLASKSVAGKLRQVGGGGNVVDLTHVENAAEAHLKAASALESAAAVSGKVYFVTDGSPVNLWDWIRDFLSRSGLPPPRGRVPLGLATASGKTLEAVYRFLGISSEPPLTAFAASQLGTSHYFDISAARRDLGYNPVVDQEKALDEASEWIRKRFASVARGKFEDRK